MSLFAVDLPPLINTKEDLWHIEPLADAIITINLLQIGCDVQNAFILTREFFHECPLISEHCCNLLQGVLLILTDDYRHQSVQ